MWVVANDGLFAQQIDFALKSPAGYRYAANRSGFVYFGGAALDAPWIRVYRAKDVTKRSGERARLRHRRQQARRRRAVEPRRSGSAAAPARRHQDRRRRRAVRALAWSTLAYPDNAKAPIFGLLVDGMTIFAGIARSQNAATGQYLYRSTNGGTSWALTSLQRRRRRARARLRSVEAHHDLRRRRRLQGRHAQRRARRRLVEVDRRRRQLDAHLDEQRHARRRIAAHHRRRSDERHARLGLLRSAQQHQRHRRRHLREPRRRRDAGRRSRRRTASSPSPIPPPKDCSRTRPAAPT